MANLDEILRSNVLLSESSKKKLFSKQNGDYGYGWNLVKFPFMMHMVTHYGRVPGYRSIFVRGVDKDICLIISNK